MEDLIRAHLDWCAVDCAEGTIAAKGIVLRAAHRDLPNGILATDREISAYLAAGHTRSGQRWSLKTRAVIRTHLKVFFEWATATGELDYSPMATIRAIHVPPGQPRPWTNDQLAELLDRARQPFRLAVVLAAYAGLRCCEIVHLGPWSRRLDVVRYRDETGRLAEVEQEVIRVVGKGGKIAEVEMHDRVRAELANFPGAAPKVPYIVQASGKEDAHWLSREAGRYFREKLGMRVTLHGGRHWFMTGVLEETDNLRAAQAAGRHSSISSTVGYTALRNGQRRRGILALPVLDEAA